MRAVKLVIAHFPERSQAVRRLYLCDPQFRGICEEFALSVLALRHFETRPDAELRPEVGDYRTLLKELADELCTYLDTARRA